MKIIFQILLPFWLDLPNSYQLQFEYDSKSFTILIIQDYWRIWGRNDEGDSISIFIKECDIIDKETMRIKKEFPKLRDYGFSEAGLNHFIPKKMETCLEISAEFVNLPVDSDLEKLWDQIQTEINRLLSIHSYMKLQSTFPPSHNLFLHSKYYNQDNTRIFIKKEDENLSQYTPDFFLTLPRKSYLTETIFTQESQKFLELRFSQGRRRLRTREHIISRIKLAKLERDANGLIFYTTLLLELVMKKVLSEFHKLNPNLLDVLFKEQGLQYFVKTQLPSFVPQYNDLITQAIKIVEKRNHMAHRGSVFDWKEEIKNSCDKTIKLTTKIEKEKKVQEFKHDTKIMGFIEKVDEKNPKKVFVRVMESWFQSEFESRHFFPLNAKRLDIIKNSFPIQDYNEIPTPPIIPKETTRWYKKDNQIFIIFSPHLTFSEFNNDTISKIFNYIEKNLIEIQKVIINVVYLAIPNKIHELLMKKLEDQKNLLDIPIEIEDLQYFAVGHDPIVLEMLEIFKSKENSMLGQSLTKNLGKINIIISEKEIGILYPKILLWEKREDGQYCRLNPLMFKAYEKYKVLLEKTKEKNKL
jgi:hypothetical protein